MGELNRDKIDKTMELVVNWPKACCECIIRNGLDPDIVVDCPVGHDCVKYPFKVLDQLKCAECRLYSECYGNVHYDDRLDCAKFKPKED